ncbi:acid phosphatase-domain-containing protein [Lipomyces tetrasporus]|uniref:Acid phosphatase-domain-containing protein n=1 Tax=Lipomyces tetrasporus TaxID=54092 RepID=A0AAD7QRF5_9ASCO|nr:acid phosphatase-domain-containing protein [Lipomyces tetrasporus]KAJ8100093.1 acid phosphatase-domain-containing protein [Lipomyces tetrasporus]
MGRPEESLPKIVVFDLDYTLWRKYLECVICLSGLVDFSNLLTACWCDTHISPRVTRSKDENAIVDRYGSKMAFYKDVPEIIAHLKQNGVKVAAASRTCAPDVAKKMLKIYPGSKITHFNFIQKQTGFEYHDMLLFDDETRNKEVEHRLGVKFMFVIEGVTWKLYHQAIEAWRDHKGHRSQ